MLNINNYSKFKKEIAQYKRDIEKISNERVNKECYTILNKIIQEYNYINATHDVSNKNIDPTKVRENVERAGKLRLRLNKIIKDSTK